MANKKDTDYVYASTRIRALERTLLSRERRERLLDAATEEETRRILQECGYVPEDLSSSDGIERMLRRRRQETDIVLTSICPEPALVEQGKIPFDYHNLKVYLKAEARGISAAGLYSSAGRVPPEKLEDALQKQRLSLLPADLAAAAELGRSLLARTGDPQRMDLALDQACQQAQNQAANRSGSQFLQGLVQLRADAGNLRLLVRAARLNRDLDFVRSALLPGGSKMEGQLLAAFSGSLTAVFDSWLAEAAALGETARSGGGTLTAFETAVENGIQAYLRQSKRVAFGPEPLVSYAAAREEELKTVRTILTGRLYHTDTAVLRERLRDAYEQ